MGEVKNDGTAGGLTEGRNRTRRRWPKHAVVLGAIALSLLVISPADAGGAGVVEIPVSTVVRTEPGVQTLLGSASVPHDLVGTSCGVESRA